MMGRNQIDACPACGFFNSVAKDLSKLLIDAQLAVMEVHQHDRLRCLLKELVEVGLLLFLGSPSCGSQPAGHESTQQECKNVGQLLYCHDECAVRCDKEIIDRHHRQDHGKQAGAC